MKITFKAAADNTGAVTININSVGAKDLVHPDGSAIAAGEIVQNGIYQVLYESTIDDFILISPREGYLISTTAINSINEPQNVGLAASVATNHLTIALKGRDGNDPSATNPVYIPFRDETLTTGTYDVIAVTSALSIVIEDGETLGHTEGTEELIYVYALNNAGTVELAVAHKGIFDEGSLHSTTALSASADDSYTLYSTTARTSDPIQLLGRIQVELDDATSGSGNWDTAPTAITPWYKGMKRTGDIIQRRYTSDNTATTLPVTGTIPLDDTIPQNTEGDAYTGLDQTITPHKIGSTLRFIANISCSPASSENVVISLFKDSESDAKDTSIKSQLASNAVFTHRFFYEELVTSLSASSWTFRVGGNNGFTIVINGQGSSGNRYTGS
jgi:hypothetical protein